MEKASRISLGGECSSEMCRVDWWKLSQSSIKGGMFVD